VYAEIDRRFPTMPFAARQLSDPRHSALGLKECVGRELLRVLPMDREVTPDAVVAQCVLATHSRHVCKQLLAFVWLGVGRLMTAACWLLPNAACSHKDHRASLRAHRKYLLIAHFRTPTHHIFFPVRMVIVERTYSHTHAHAHAHAHALRLHSTRYRFTVLLHGGKTVSLADHRMQPLAPTRGPPADVIRKLVGSADKPAKQTKWEAHAHLPAAVAELPIVE
jgi:hypothetical protein